MRCVRRSRDSIDYHQNTERDIVSTSTLPASDSPTTGRHDERVTGARDDRAHDAREVVAGREGDAELRRLAESVLGRGEDVLVEEADDSEAILPRYARMRSLALGKGEAKDAVAALIPDTQNAWSSHPSDAHRGLSSRQHVLPVTIGTVTSGRSVRVTYVPRALATCWKVFRGRGLMEIETAEHQFDRERGNFVDGTACAYASEAPRAAEERDRLWKAWCRKNTCPAAGVLYAPRGLLASRD
ncbi:hypothetical protein C8T65DRAFT_831884 [Cerioporus squamosus]|nr:hypothetical protein C8T65DRAFT_831884 [Cerioporus squamosus]